MSSLISSSFQLFKSVINRSVFIRNVSQLDPVKLVYTSYDSAFTLNAPPLLVHHGLFGSKQNWNSLCKVYQKKTSRRIIAVDARNHGESPHTSQHTYELLVADLKNLINSLGLDKVALLGHSMGGRTVMLLALKYPHVVEKIIVADISPIRISPNFDQTSEIFNILQNINLPTNMSMSNARSQTDRELAKFIDDKGLRAFILTNLKQKQDGSFDWRINIDNLRSNFAHLATFPKVTDLEYKGPVLFIGGGNSDYIKKSDHKGILKLFPKARFEYIEGAGHWLHSEKPAEFLESTVNFLNQN